MYCWCLAHDYSIKLDACEAKSEPSTTQALLSLLLLDVEVGVHSTDSKLTLAHSVWQEVIRAESQRNGRPKR